MNIPRWEEKRGSLINRIWVNTILRIYSGETLALRVLPLLLAVGLEALPPGMIKMRQDQLLLAESHLLPA